MVKCGTSWLSLTCIQHPLMQVRGTEVVIVSKLLQDVFVKLLLICILLCRDKHKLSLHRLTMGGNASQFSVGGKTKDYNISSNNRYQVIMVGLDNAGKSTLLYRFKLGKDTNTLPTVGFNAEEISASHISSGKAYSFIMWDIAGQDKPTSLRHLWAHHLMDSEGILYVVDCADKDRLIEAKRELFSRVLNRPEVEGVPLIVIANKQDVEGAVTGDELALYLGLSAHTTNEWQVREASGVNGAGTTEVLDAMFELIENQKKKTENKVKVACKHFKEHLSTAPLR